MAETVKTGLLKAIEAILTAGLPEMSTVRRDWMLPFDLGSVALPALLFYEESDDLWRLSRITQKIIDLNLVVFAAFSGPVYEEDNPAWENNAAWQEFKDWADAIAGKIHSLWHNRDILTTLRAAGLIRLEELGNHKAPANAEYGELVLTYNLTYGHALGDAFTRL